jgi:hypothetical protein
MRAEVARAGRDHTGYGSVTLVRDIEWEACLLEPRRDPELEKRIQRELGRDRIEAVIVPFARETVWYQAAQIQRRAREVREALPRQQFLELIAVAAIANAVCRLGIVVDEHP